jgi:type IV fimbrial biogenesis protein FimT
MKDYGFTLIELLIVIVVLTILTAGAAPLLKQSMENARTKAAKYELLAAVEHARSIAVFTGSRSVIKAKNQWHDGWEIFSDTNDNGIADNNEPILIDHTGVQGVNIIGKNQVATRISFIGTGEARAPGRHNAGAFIAGTLLICPENKGAGYKLVLSRGGRMRSAVAQAQDCS